MKFKKKLLATLILAGQMYPASAALIRDDIDVQVYRDFGENRGIFSPGSTNIPIYHIDGSLSGMINVMPDFRASNDSGWGTLIDPQASVTALHVPYTGYASFGKRYQQLDATLFSGAENASSYTLMNEVTNRAYEVSAGTDYKLVREQSVVTDAAPAEYFTDTSQFKYGLLIARTGAGTLGIATAPGVTDVIGSGVFAGGLNIITGVGLSADGNVYTLSFSLAVNQKTALDVGTLVIDSGSGMWAWDTVSQGWKFLGVNSAGSSTGYNKGTYLRSAPEWTQETIDSFTDPSIATANASDIIYIGAQDIHTGEGDFTLNGDTIRYHGIRTDIAKSARVDTDFMSNKNLILGGAGGTLQLNAANFDLGAGSITFNSDYTLSDGGDSSRRMNTAGYIINAGATVISNLTGSVGDIWRKIGLGTLVIGGSGVNHSNLYVGDGLTILQRLGGHAADAMHISSGRAVVRLGAADQLEGTQVGFGTGGGVLDLYGQSLSWNDIIHMDNGATIGTSKANTLSTFTFTGSGPKTYLGNFFDGGSADKGLLHLVYAPGTAGSSWTLKGNINTRGGMDILNGNLAIQGALVLHAGGYIDPTQYESARFDLGDSLVSLTGSQFTVGRNAMARGHFVLDDASSLVMTSGGEVGYDGQGVAEGAYLDGSVNLSGAHSVLKVTPEEAFRVQINAALSGAGHIIKEGLGSLYLTGVNTLTGSNLISSGRVITDTLTSLGMQTDGWTIADAGVLDVGNNTDSLATILDKISDSSRGVLALTGAITSADMMALLTKDLYLGSSSTLELGVSGQNLTNGAQDLYLGGGDGEVKIKGYLPSSGSSLYLGNGQSAGTVHIESMNENWVGNVDLRRGIRLITDYENSLGNGRLSVNYGSVAGSNLLRNITLESAGMMSATTASSFGYDMSAFQRLALGADAGETLALSDTLKATQTGYYFSGSGNVLINSALLAGNNLTVDAQDNDGGIVTLNTVNDLNSLVTVRGYNSDSSLSRKSDMTLQMGVDNALDKSARVVLEDGGVLDLNGHSVVLNVESSSLNSKILSSDSTHASTLNLAVDKDTTLNSLISGADMHLVKSGIAALTVNGASDFTGDVLLSAGKTLVGNNLAFGAAANIVTVAKEAMLDLNGHNLSNVINLASGSLINSRAGAVTVGTLSLSADSTATFNGTTDLTTVSKYQLNGKRLTVNNVYTALSGSAIDNGDLVFNNSQVNWNGNNTLLSSSGSLTVGNGSVLELRDVNQTAGVTKTIILDGGMIGSGTKAGGNGGGAGATLRSALQVDTSGTLNGNNWNYGILLGLYGPISGHGTLNITGGQGVAFYGDTSAFTGNLLLKHNSKLYLGPVADTTLAANLSQEGTGKIFKTNFKTLTLTGDNHAYTNELDVQGGTLVLGSSTAATGGDIRMTGGTLMLNSDSKVSLSNLAAGSSVDLHGYSGTLTVKANAAGSTITSSDTDNWSALNLLVGTNTTLNSAITGQKIHLNKQGTGNLTLAASNTFTGDALLSAGKTLLGNSQALGNAANNVTVANTATLDQNGYDLSNGVIFDGGTLTSGSSAANQKINGSLDVATLGTLLADKSSLNLYGALSGSGTLNIAGILGASLNGDTSAFTGKLWVKNSSQLVFASDKDTVLAGNLVSETGSKIVKQGNNALTLSGNNQLWASLLDLNQGYLIISQAQSTPAGEIAINGGRLIFAADEDMTPDTLLSGSAGQMVKSGSGKLTLNQQNTFDQETLVEEGILEIGDAQHDWASLAGDVRVNSGGTLQGYGSIGGDLLNSGIVRPAGAGKSLRISGNYTQTADSWLFIDIDPLTGASLLDITGHATLAGGVKTIYAPGTYTPQSYVFLSAQGGIEGEFASLSSGVEGLDQQLSYDANNVSLSTSAVSVDPVDPIVDPTDPVVDPIVDPTDPVVDPIVDPTDPVVDPIVDPTDPVVDPIVDPTDPVTPPPQPRFVVTPSNLHAYDMQLLSLGMQKPTQWSMEQVDWSTASAGKSVCDLSGSCYHDDAMWIMPHMSNGSLTEGDGNAKVDGISIGGYTEMGNTRLGVSVDYSDFDLSEQGSSASADRYAVNLFASQKLDSMVLTGSLGYTHAATEVTRQVDSSGMKLGEGKSDITGNAVSAGLSANWSIVMGNTTIVPQVGVDSLNVFYSGFDEHMSSDGELFGKVINKMKVRGDSDRYDSVQPNVGVKITHGLAFGNTEVIPALKVTYRRELMNNNNGVVASNDGTLFTVQSDTLGRDIIEYEAGVEVKLTPCLSTSFSYTGSNQQGYQSQEGMIRVKYNF